MLVAAVKAIAAQSPALKDPDKGLVPDVVDVREISVKVAMAVIKQAIEEGLATEKDVPENDDGMCLRVDALLRKTGLVFPISFAILRGPSHSVILLCFKNTHSHLPLCGILS